MPTKNEVFIQTQLKKDLPDIRPGDTLRIHQKIKEIAKKKKGKEKEAKGKIQVFEGIVIARKHGKEAGATITVRKVISGIGVEKIFPIHSPNIEKIEIVKRAKVRRAKLYYLRKAKGKKARLKRKELAEAIVWEEEKPVEEKPKTTEEKPTEEMKEKDETKQ